MYAHVYVRARVRTYVHGSEEPNSVLQEAWRVSSYLKLESKLLAVSFRFRRPSRDASRYCKMAGLPPSDLLSPPPPDEAAYASDADAKLARACGVYKPTYQPFIVPAPDATQRNRQYSHMYRRRLQALAGPTKQVAMAAWQGSGYRFADQAVQTSIGEKVVIVGIVTKTMDRMPDILHELSLAEKSAVPDFDNGDDDHDGDFADADDATGEGDGGVAGGNSISSSNNNNSSSSSSSNNNNNGGGGSSGSSSSSPTTTTSSILGGRAGGGSASRNYVGDTDRVLLEDRSGRIAIGGSIDPKLIVPGAVMGFRGTVEKGPVLVVDACCFPGFAPQAPLPAPPTAAAAGDETVLFVCGLGFGSRNFDSLRTKLLLDFINGSLGGRADARRSATVSRVVVAGRSVRPSAVLEGAAARRTEKKAKVCVFVRVIEGHSTCRDAASAVDKSHRSSANKPHQPAPSTVPSSTIQRNASVAQADTDTHTHTTHTHTHSLTHSLTHRQTDKQTHRHTHAHTHADQHRHTHARTSHKPHRHTHTHTHADQHRHTHTRTHKPQATRHAHK